MSYLKTKAKSSLHSGWLQGFVMIGLAVALSLACFISLAGCAGQNPSSNSTGNSNGNTSTEPISVYSREDGSGTRSAFIELFGLEEKDASGKKIDKTTDNAAITNSTSVMMTSVANDPEGIGYISLGSLNDTVKALKIDGVDPTPNNVKDGSYKIARPFNVVLDKDTSAAAQDFISFIMSKEGQSIVEENHYIAVAENAEPYQKSDATGKVVIAGSSSVTPVMEKLAEAYKKMNPNVTIEVQQSDSTTGITMAKEGTCDIGMASRDLKDSEASAGLEAIAIAQDGIAVIVTPNSTVDALTTAQVKDIFSGATQTWVDVIE